MTETSEAAAHAAYMRAHADAMRADADEARRDAVMWRWIVAINAVLLIATLAALVVALR